MILNISKKEKPKEVSLYRDFSAVVHNDNILYLRIPALGWISLCLQGPVTGLHHIDDVSLCAFDKPVKILSINVEEI